MATVTVHEVEDEFARILARVAQGEEVTICQKGVPIARLLPIGKEIVPRKPGSARGKIVIHPDFDVPLPADILETFES